jgi:hypothetical protein
LAQPNRPSVARQNRRRLDKSHQDRERYRDRGDGFEINNGHAKPLISATDTEHFQNALKTKPGFSVKFPLGLIEIRVTGLFSDRRCAILAARTRFCRRDDAGQCLKTPLHAPPWRSN